MMLHVIPTPIWNLDDITLRALNLFKELNYFICEDTRTFKKLLNAYEIDYKDKKFFSLTSYTKPITLQKYLNIIKENDVWLVSEAWTPGLSDPGKQLIKLCRENNIKFEILPWPNALIPAVIWACFPTNEFCFLWFLPQKWREKKLKDALEKNKTIFFYESVHRIKKIFKELKNLWFNWKIIIAREISKKFEQYECWEFNNIYEKFINWLIQLKWEFVIWLHKN